jgi:hypothetical protein
LCKSLSKSFEEGRGEGSVSHTCCIHKYHKNNNCILHTAYCILCSGSGSGCHCAVFPDWVIHPLEALSRLDKLPNQCLVKLRVKGQLRVKGKIERVVPAAGTAGWHPHFISTSGHQPHKVEPQPTRNFERWSQDGQRMHTALCCLAATVPIAGAAARFACL